MFYLPAVLMQPSRLYGLVCSQVIYYFYYFKEDFLRRKLLVCNKLLTQ